MSWIFFEWLFSKIHLRSSVDIPCKAWINSFCPSSRAHFDSCIFHSNTVVDTQLFEFFIELINPFLAYILDNLVCHGDSFFLLITSSIIDCFPSSSKYFRKKLHFSSKLMSFTSIKGTLGSWIKISCINFPAAFRDCPFFVSMFKLFHQLFIFRRNDKICDHDLINRMKIRIGFFFLEYLSGC